MPVLSGPQVVSELRCQLKNQSGRHLYVVLGSYSQLEAFERNDLGPAQMVDGQPFPQPLAFNRELLARIEDEALRRMVRDESRLPTWVQKQLNQAFDQLLRHAYEQHAFVIFKQCELMFTYDLDASKLRTSATNQNHLLLLLPGRLVGQRIQLFYEADPRFERQFPGGLVTENNLWELSA